MIPAPLARLGLAAFLCSAASFAMAQQPTQQRSRTEPRKPAAQTQPAQQRGTAATTQKPGARAAAQQKPAAGAAKPGAGSQAKPGAKGPGGAQATLLATFGDWGAYASGQGRTKVCYALSRPKERLPKDLKRDEAYLFVSFRPGDNVRNEIAVVLGFAARESGPAEAVIGTATYALITKGENAWIRNSAEENQVVVTMMRGQSLDVKATSGRGNATTDQYSLSGFTKALERARTECS